jgi:similar to stage IV sporulation protein
MKNQWIEFIFGEVTTKVTGKGIERFLNVLTRNGLHIWNVKRHGTDTVTFKIRVQDAFKIRPFVKHSGCEVSFLQRNGAPFLFKRMLKNSGFVLGAVLFLFIIIFLSNVVWGIDIKGAKPATEYKIRKELDKMGVKIGKVQFFIDNVDTIQKKLTDNIGAITWVGVELKGTTYQLQVVEKKQPKEPEQPAPRNLIAVKKATIVKMEVEKGQKLVDIHDQVAPGQIIVSGLIGKEGEEIPIAAKGKVWGETWYKSHVELPLKTNFNVYNGKEEQKYLIKAGNVEIPIWGFGKSEYKDSKTEETSKPIHFLKWDLPVFFESKTIRERETVERVYNEQEAVKIATEMAKKDLKHHINEDAKIKNEKILHKAIENGKVILDIHFKVIENIAQEQPIVQELPKPKETHE